MKSRGMALVSVLILMVVIASAASLLFAYTSQVLDHISRQRAEREAEHLLVGAFQVAASNLPRITAMSTGGQLSFPPTQVGTGEFTGSIEEVQGLFNLNNIVLGEEQLNLFRRLLSSLGLAAELADSLADWLDKDNDSRFNGAEDAHYLSLSPSYRSANTLLEDFSALKRVKGFDEATLERLRPYATVIYPENGLPLTEPVLINVNAAPPLLLELLFPGLDPSLLLKRREVLPFLTRDDVNTWVGNNGGKTGAAFTVVSDYYLLTGQAKTPHAHVRRQALLHRPGVLVWEMRK